MSTLEFIFFLKTKIRPDTIKEINFLTSTGDFQQPCRLTVSSTNPKVCVNPNTWLPVYIR